MIDREKVKKGLDLCLTGEASVCEDCPYDAECKEARGIGPSPLRMDALALLKKQPEIVRCKDCKHWDKTTREAGNDCISGPWEDAVCEVFRDWDSYGELGEHFWRTNGDWFCADGERR